MEIGKINNALEQMGYNPFAVGGGTSNEDAQKLAEKNGISIEEAQNILKEAEEKAEENDRIMSQQAALMAELLNDQDEEEIEIVDDIDFDNFLKEESPEQKMQALLQQQLFANSNNSQDTFNRNNQEDNPFLKM